jgi:hypothetical protein
MCAEPRVNNTRKTCNTKNRGRPCQSVKRSVVVSRQSKQLYGGVLFKLLSFCLNMEANV